MLRNIMLVALACGLLAGCFEEREKPWYKTQTPDDEPVVIAPDKNRVEIRLP